MHKASNALLHFYEGVGAMARLRDAIGVSDDTRDSCVRGRPLTPWIRSRIRHLPSDGSLDVSREQVAE
ncbi:hypothetical protein JHU04_003491 [Brenneria sp. 4F2]|nr:hypothetical protein [Brenneria bubanii]